jgi:hypothetical protein
VSRHARRSAGVIHTGDTAELESAPAQARRAIEEAEVVRAARTRPFAISLAVLSTALCAGFVLTSSGPATSVTVAQPAPMTATVDSNVDTLSRGALDREAAVASEDTTTAAAPVTIAAPAPTVLYVTSIAYLRQQANASAKVLATLAVGTQVTATGDAADGWQPVTSGSTTGFVKAALLSATGQPAATTAKKTAAGSSAAGAAGAYPACASGSGVESGLAANTIRVHRAVCTTYPSITAYGGLSGSGGEHATGHALDIMVSGSLGVDVAAWLRANYASLGITEIIYQQQIWTTQRSSEGWRAMADRGSATANHYDHIHVLVS